MLWATLSGQHGPGVTLGANSQSPIPMRDDVLLWPAIRKAVEREFAADAAQFRFVVDDSSKKIGVLRRDAAAQLAITFRGDRFQLVSEGARAEASELQRRGKALVESVVDNPQWLVPMQATWSPL